MHMPRVQLGHDQRVINVGWCVSSIHRTSAFGTLFAGVRGVSLSVWCRKLEVDAFVMYAQDAEPT